MAKKIPKNSIEVGVKKHWVTITDGNLIHIHHTKECLNPCEITMDIIDYLKAELLITDKFKVMEVTEDE